MASTARSSTQLLKHHIPWLKSPLIVGAPMRTIAGPALALAISSAGGFGFLNPAIDALESDLSETAKLVSESESLTSLAKQTSPPGRLPIGVGFLLWGGGLDLAVKAVEKYPPVAVWLFAPNDGQKELDEWAAALRKAAPGVLVWQQIASVSDALAAANSSFEQPPDVLVVQGSDAGGHSRARGAGIVTLLPEVADALKGTRMADTPLIAAGGISESRGLAATLALGASGAVMGTRFLASHEARLPDGYRKHVVDASDGGQRTTRTLLYNHLRGIYGWPEGYEPRLLINKSWHDQQGGMEFEENLKLHKEASQASDGGWGEEGRVGSYAGTGVGLIKDVKAAGHIVRETREGITKVLEEAIQHAE